MAYDNDGLPLPSNWECVGLNDAGNKDRANRLVYTKRSQGDRFLIRKQDQHQQHQYRGRLVHAKDLPYLYIWCSWSRSLSDLDFYAYWNGLGGNNDNRNVDPGKAYPYPPKKDYQSAGYHNEVRYNDKIITDTGQTFYLLWSGDKRGYGNEEWFGIKNPGYSQKFTVHMRFWDPVSSSISADQIVSLVKVKWMSGGDEVIVGNAPCGYAYESAGVYTEDGYHVRACNKDPSFSVEFVYDQDHDYDVAVVSITNGPSARVPCPVPQSYS